MTRPLTVHNAQITTAAVEVKTLTISGKQVTLSVFRQLQETRLVRDDGVLCGIPWGTVNYHPDKVRIDDGDAWGGKPKDVGCADAPRHLHVVWQEGDELRRSLVFCPSWYGQHYADWGDDRNDPERVGYRETWKALHDLPQLFIAV